MVEIPLDGTKQPYILHKDSFIEPDLSSYDDWTPQELADAVAKAGMGDYREVIIAHKITGKIAHLLSDSDLKDMGIVRVGDRIRFRQMLMTFSRKARFKVRRRDIWSAEEQRFYTDPEEYLCTCCGIFPGEPSIYKLTNGRLKIKDVRSMTCGPLTLYCFTEYISRNIDLTEIKDIDVIQTVAPCPQRVFCCSPGKDLIEIHTQGEKEAVGNTYLLILKGGTGESVSELIMHQVELTQMEHQASMERG